MVRASQSHRKGRVGLGLAAIVAAAALAVPALPALADGDGYRRGRSHQRDHGRSSHRHSHRGHGHSHGHHHLHGHHHHHHHGSGLRVRIGVPPIVIGHRPSPVYVRERVVVREPAYLPPPPPPPQTIIISQPPPPPPPPVYVPAQTSPVIRTTPRQATVVIPSGPSAGATPAAVAAPTPVAPPPVQAVSPLDVLPKELTVSAYRAGDTIMVVVKGVNPAGTFSTALTSGDLSGESPQVVLRNTPVPGGAAEGETEFHVTIALHLERAVSAVTVLVADKAYRVQIVDVPSLS